MSVHTNNSNDEFTATIWTETKKEKIYKLWFPTYHFALPLGGCGIFLNIFGICFLATKKKTTFSKLLMILAMVDTIFLISSLLHLYLDDIIDYNCLRLILAPYVFPIHKTSLMISINLTISMAIERYLAIVKPFSRGLYPCLTKARTYAIPSIIFSILFSLIMWFSFTEIIIISDCHANVEKPYFKDSNIRFDFFIFNSKEILDFIFGILLPIIVLISLSILIRNGLIRARFTGAEELNDTEQRMARIGFVIVIIFIICNSVRIIESGLNVIYGNSDDLPYWHYVLLLFKFPLLILNSSINFVVYFLHTGKVEQALATIMLKQKNSSTKAQQQSTLSATTENHMSTVF